MPDPSPPPRWFMRFQWRAHKLVWRMSRGRIGAKVMGMPVLELVTTGRKSGEPRSVLITYILLDGVPVVAGTNAGSSRDPAWVHNLRADPRCHVTLHGRTRSATGTFLEGDAHSTAWERFEEASDDYASYRGMIERPVPLVALTGSAAS